MLSKINKLCILIFDPESVKIPIDHSCKKEKLNKKISKYMDVSLGSVISVNWTAEPSLINKDMILGTKTLLTDGEWTWTNKISYYVSKNAYALPEEFVHHLNRNRFKKPNLVPNFRALVGNQHQKKIIAAYYSSEIKQGNPSFEKGKINLFPSTFGKKNIFNAFPENQKNKEEYLEFNSMGEVNDYISNQRLKLTKGAEFWVFKDDGTLVEYVNDKNYERDLINSNTVSGLKWFIMPKRFKHLNA